MVARSFGKLTPIFEHQDLIRLSPFAFVTINTLTINYYPCVKAKGERRITDEESGRDRGAKARRTERRGSAWHAGEQKKRNDSVARNGQSVSEGARGDR